MRAKGVSCGPLPPDLEVTAYLPRNPNPSLETCPARLVREPGDSMNRLFLMVHPTVGCGQAQPLSYLG